MSEDEFVIGGTKLSPGAPVKVRYREREQDEISELEGILLGQTEWGWYVRVMRQKMNINDSLPDLIDIKKRVENMSIEEAVDLLMKIETTFIGRLKGARNPHQRILDIVIDKNERIMVSLEAPAERFISKDVITTMTYLVDEEINDVLSRLASDE